MHINCIDVHTILRQSCVLRVLDVNFVSLQSETCWGVISSSFSFCHREWSFPQPLVVLFRVFFSAWCQIEVDFF